MTRENPWAALLTTAWAGAAPTIQGYRLPSADMRGGVWVPLVWPDGFDEERLVGEALGGKVHFFLDAAVAEGRHPAWLLR